MGPIEIAILTALVLLLFGSKRLPNVGEALGETLGYVRGKAEQKVDDSGQRPGTR